MSDLNVALSQSSAVDDLRNALLGDARRTARLESIVDALSTRPADSVPEALADEAAIEGYYRFVRNEAVSSKAIVHPHHRATAARAELVDETLVLHDSTEFAFSNETENQRRDGLGVLSANRQGFRWHASMVVAGHDLRAPLGLIASQPFVFESETEGDDELRQFWRDQGGLFDNPKWRWMEGVEQSEAELKALDSVIHVMDREGDDYQMMSAMTVSGYSFVIRLAHDRNIKTGKKRSDYAHISDVISSVPWSAQTRTVELSARAAAQATKTHPRRRKRQAELSVRAMCAEIRRPDSVLTAEALPVVEINIVEVRELDPPEGEPAVSWLLVTDQPVETLEEIWKVVDIYRSRWLIEEFFKALKTGCGYTKLQHRSAHTLLNALAIHAPIAWEILTLRYLDRHARGLPAPVAANSVQVAVLRKEYPDIIGTEPTVGDVMRCVGKLGGHLKSNGPPGWLVLGRGWKRLRQLEQGFRVAMDVLGVEM